MLKDLWELFYTFAKVGVMTFGGGYAMLPILQREVVEKKGWATDEELTDYFAIGQCTPGVIAVNTATFVGQKHAGVAGGIIATLGVVFPSLIIISALAKVITAYAHLSWVQHAFAGIRAAEDAGFQNLKLDTVLMGGVNDDEIADFVRLTKERPLSVRFIELMPMGICAGWDKARFLPAKAVLDRVPELEPVGTDGVSRIYRLPGALGTVGLIEPMSHAFCSNCSRIRITADGKLKPCLHSETEIPLRGLSGEALREAIMRGVAMKPKQHELTRDGESRAGRGMNEIGG